MTRIARLVLALAMLAGIGLAAAAPVSATQYRTDSPCNSGGSFGYLADWTRYNDAGGYTRARLNYTNINVTNRIPFGGGFTWRVVFASDTGVAYDSSYLYAPGLTTGPVSTPTAANGRLIYHPFVQVEVVGCTTSRFYFT